VQHALGTLVRVVDAEGTEGARNRLLDRIADWRRRRGFRRATGPVEAAGLHVAILNVLSTPPAPRLGGVQIQFLGRIGPETERRPVALLHPERGGYRRAVAAGRRRLAWRLGGAPLAWPPPLEDAGLEAAVLRAARALDARAVHFEGLAGLPLASVRRVGDAGVRLLLSVHDFA